MICIHSTCLRTKKGILLKYAKKIEVPIEFLPSKVMQENLSLYGFINEFTIVSYVPEKNKTVLLICSMHDNQCIDKEIGKPEIIALYNSTNGRVVALDKKWTV